MSENAEEEDEEDENEMIHTNTYSEYMPMKVKVGYLHPDPVVETRYFFLQTFSFYLFKSLLYFITNVYTF